MVTVAQIGSALPEKDCLMRNNTWIGVPLREIIVEPEPLTVPAPVPSEPDSPEPAEPEPVEEPAEPVEVPV